MMVNQSSSYRWYVKFFDAFFIVIASVYLLHSLTWFLPEMKASLDLSFLRLRYKYLIIPSIAGLVYVLITVRRQNTGAFNADKVHAIIFGIIRFWLATGISYYGFAKILGTQFNGADEIILRDSLLGDIGGNYLTWYYFNFSHPYMLVIGYLQIGAALLLLYRRTTLLGVCLLLPVMVNIVLIDIFYSIPPEPTAFSIVFTAALLYLLLLYSQTIITFFLKRVYALPGAGIRTIKNILRAAVIIFAFTGVFHEYALTNKDTSRPGNDIILGKWKVEQYMINGVAIRQDAWQTNTGLWGSIYFFNSRYCAISPNPYFFDRTNQNFGQYSFDKPRHLLNIYFLKSKDTLQGSIDFVSGNQALVKGLLGRDTINLHLRKVKM